ncbi:MAG: PH domain-containing protein [Armatimonadetes bacterium]|nr:PH domain-containing protein [Armatimonadota bacterium]
MDEERKRKLVYGLALPALFFLACAVLSVELLGFAMVMAAFYAGIKAMFHLCLQDRQRTSEILPRAGSSREKAHQGRIIIRGPRWPWAPLAWLFLALVISPFDLIDRDRVVLALLSVICWWKWLGRGDVALEADDDGLTRCSLFGGNRLSWDQVADVQIDTDSNALGQAVRTVCRFRSEVGGEVLKLTLSQVPEDSRSRLIEFIRAKQGLPPGTRTELEAAMPPEGLGTELETAPAPEGRGTELEAARRG